MGLDNYITARNIKREDIPTYLKDAFPFYAYNCEKYYENSRWDFAYFRKYWSFRNEVIAELHLPNDGVVHSLDLEDLGCIIRILYRYTSYDYWSENDDCIWLYDEALPHIIESLICLKWLYYYWESHPEIQVEFIDSY